MREARGSGPVSKDPVYSTVSSVAFPPSMGSLLHQQTAGRIARNGKGEDVDESIGDIPIHLGESEVITVRMPGSGSMPCDIALGLIAATVVMIFPGPACADLVSSNFIASRMDDGGCRLDLSTSDHGDDGCSRGDDVSGYRHQYVPDTPWWEWDQTCPVVESSLSWETLDHDCSTDAYGTYHCSWSGFTEMDVPCELLSFEQICSGSCCGWLQNAEGLDIDFEEACSRAAGSSPHACAGCSISAIKGTEAGIVSCLTAIFLLAMIASRRISRATK
jgi:hypothetical protein